ncbi:MAG TPA: hypothetical protein V6C78_02785 [Crinalium sp.]|jgi:hypothetical protein
MDAADTAKRSGRRTRSNNKGTVDNTSGNLAETEKAMVEQEKKAETNGDSKPAAKTEVTALSLKTEAEREAEQGSIEVAEMFFSAGERPIAASHLHIYGTILNNRPIMASDDIRVLDTTLVGGRPIFASHLLIRDDLSLPGGRPVFASDPHLLEASLLPGGRPIASNEIDDAETLMGFLD